MKEKHKSVLREYLEVSAKLEKLYEEERKLAWKKRMLEKKLRRIFDVEV